MIIDATHSPSTVGIGGTKTVTRCITCGCTSRAALEAPCSGDPLVVRASGDTSGLPPLKFTYRNWRGEVRVREATPCGEPWFGSTEWHPEKQWLLPMRDAEDGKRKDFAVKDICAFQDGV